MPTPETQLHKAWVRSGLTLLELVERAGLDLSIVSVSRKLRGLQTMSREEAKAFSVALGCPVRFGGTERRRGVAA